MQDGYSSHLTCAKLTEGAPSSSIVGLGRFDRHPGMLSWERGSDDGGCSM
jgi:hypothetical protein